MNASLLAGLKNNLLYSQHFYAQTRLLYPTIEIVFVSYNSTDGTHQWLDSLRDGHVRYYHENVERTLSDAYNKCIDLATAEYVIFAHNDMVLAPGFIENLETFLSPNRAIAYTTIEPPIFADDERPGKLVRDFGADVETFQREDLFRFAGEVQQEQAENKLMPLDDRVTFFLCAARRVLLEIGGLDSLFNPMFCEDDDLTLRLKLKGIEMVVVTTALCYHFVSKTSRFSEEYSRKTKQIEARSVRNFIRKWGFRINSSVRKRYDIGLIVTHGSLAVLREVEPWGSAVYIDIDATLYIREEQNNTAFDLAKRIKPWSARPQNGILVSIDARKLKTGELAQLEHLHEVIYEKINAPETLLDKIFPRKSISFTWNNCQIWILDQTSFEDQLIHRDFDQHFRKSFKLSYGITVCNEAVELERLLLFLLLHKDKQDEIVVLQDKTHPDRWVSDVLNKYQNELVIRTEILDNDFAAFKNKLITLASGDYLFQIDADEVPALPLIRALKPILTGQPDADCFAVPRANYIKGITPDLIEKWHWNLDDKDRINFPDYQLRLFKLNQDICWRNKVHEELYGFNDCYFLPDVTDEFCLVHVKDVDRQQRQNDFYDSL